MPSALLSYNDVGLANDSSSLNIAFGLVIAIAILPHAAAGVINNSSAGADTDTAHRRRTSFSDVHPANVSRHRSAEVLIVHIHADSPMQRVHSLSSQRICCS